MRTVLLRRASAVPVGKAGLDSGEVVLDPLGVGAGSVGVEGQRLTVDVDAALLVVVERRPDGGVVDGGVAGGHLRGGVPKHLLNDVLGHSGVDQPGPQGVAELVGGDGHTLTGLVMQADVFLPVGEPLPQRRVGEAPSPVGVGVR